MFNKRDLGKEGENQATKYLKKNGYKILERNYYSRYGEIDLIAKENSELVFVEVKFRRSLEFGHPAEAINKYKQVRIIKSALQYVKVKKLFKINIRFDVLLIGPQNDKFDLIKSAFISNNEYIY